MLNVVITGSTKGIGKALAKKFLALGDKVIISSRKEENVSITLNELSKQYQDNVDGMVCDINKYSDVEELVNFAENKFGNIGIWINNAGITDLERKSLLESDNEIVFKVIETNLISTILATKAALKSMKGKGGHIFLIEGLGTTGRASPNSLAYGASKAGYIQLFKTLIEETKEYGVGVHMVSPGMVLTDLLVENTNHHSKVFNILAEQPSTVANWLVPKMRNVKTTGKRIRYLTNLKATLRFMTSWRYKDRFYDDEGNLIVDLEN